jgi:SAM-dependent methyltransferase
MKALTDYFDLCGQYAEMTRAYSQRGVSTELNPDDNEFAPGTPMDAYLALGADAIRLIVLSLTTNLRTPPASILDFPSGSGRVTRHLRSFFPDAAITASDIYERHVDFCVNALGVEGHVSSDRLLAVDFCRRFDLIFCGSLLTHLPESGFVEALRLVSRSLSHNGLAIVTVHGRYAEFVQQYKPAGWSYFEEELFALARPSLHSTGFGFADYEWLKRSPLFDKHARYGVSFSRPHWTMGQIESDETIRILGYIERGWDNHQDAILIGKTPVNL